MEVMTFVVGVLATWRLSKMITEEEGPFMIFTRLRSTFPSDGKHGWIGRGLYCMWCVSVWIGIALGLVLSLGASPTPTVVWGVVMGLACSTGAILVDYAVEFIGQRVRK